MTDLIKVMQKAAESQLKTISTTRGSPQRFLRLIGADPESIRVTDAQHGRYQNPEEMEGLVNRYRRGLPVDPVEIHIDEFKNVVGAEGRHRAVAAMRAGIQEFPISIKRVVEDTRLLAESSMRNGEGAAVAKVGTATVSSVLKATSRIMKSAL